jgi:hypothetical protein
MWMHLISLTLRLYQLDKLSELQFYKLDLESMNKFINNIMSSNYVFDNGKIDILLAIISLCSFYLGRYYKDSLIILFVSTIILEVFLIYNEREGRLFTKLVFILGSFLLGKYTKKETNKYLLEKSFSSKDLYDEESNIQEYETYKLY